MGGRHEVTEEMAKRMHELREKGMTWVVISKRMGVSVRVDHYHVMKYRREHGHEEA